jgi:pyrroloquinoline quinone biosynthesis protein D
VSLAFALNDCPCLPRGVRLHQDHVRGTMVLLAPEKAIELDEIGVAILSRVTGQARFAEIIADLAHIYQAPVEQIEPDVQRFLMSLRARLYVMVRQ